jgi:hypothetical protein
MKVFPLLLLSICLFALLHFVWIPAFKKTLHSEKTLLSVGKAGVLGVLSFLRNFCLIAAITLSAVCLVIGAVRAFGSIGPSSLDAKIIFLEQWKEKLTQVSEYWSAGFLLVLVAVLISITYSGSRKAWRQQLDAKINSELARLKAERDAGSWTELEPTSEMVQIDAQIRRIGEAAEQIVSRGREIPSEFREAFTKLQAAWVERDLLRRMDLSVDPAPVDEQPRGWKQWLGIIFLNKGFLSTLETGQKLLGRAGTALLVITLLAVNTHNLGQVFGSEQLRLDQLRVELSKKEAEASRKNRLADQESRPKVTPSEDDKRQINQLAIAFQRMFAQAVHPMPRALLVRKGIQREIVRADHHQRFEVFSSDLAESNPGQGSTLDPIQTEALELCKREVGSREPGSLVGQRFQKELSDEAAANTPLWQSIKTKTGGYFASFQEVPDVYDVQTSLASQVIGRVIDFLPNDTTNEISKLAQQAASKFGSKAAEDAYTVLSEKFLSALKAKPIVDEAAFDALETRFVKERLQDWRQFFDSTPSIQQLAQKMERYPPSLATNSERAIDIAAVEQILKSMKDPFLSEKKLDVTDTLSDYDYWFPAHIDGQRSTLRGKTELAWNQNLPTSDGSFAKAHSFEKLRGSPHVGGVLIGCPPEGPTLDFTDFSWQEVTGGFDLRVKRGIEEISIGVFPKALIHRALAYASDERPCAVTMVFVQPIRVKKVALHPALVDTQTGRDAVDLDSFAFDYIDADPDATKWWDDVQNSVRNQNELYQRCRDLRFFAALLTQQELERSQQNLNHRILRPNALVDRREAVAKRNVLLSAIIAEFGTAADTARTDYVVHGDSALDLLLKKSEFYDSDLVNWIRDSASKTSTVEQFCENLFSRTELETRDLSEEKVKRWNSPGPEFNWVSGVREVPFSTDNKLTFIKAPNEEIPYWPLEFVLQVAFETQPGFLPTPMDPVDYADNNPWTVNQSGSKITDLVKQNLVKNPAASDVMAHMREFTILQRFFRTGLAGKLGPDFPTEKFVSLTAASAVDDYKLTPRWDEGPISTETRLVAELEQAVASVAKADVTNEVAQERSNAVSAFTHCIDTIRKSPNALQAELQRNCDVEKFGANVVHPATPADKQVLNAISRIANALVFVAQCRDLRSALRIDSSSYRSAGSVVQVRTQAEQPKEQKLNPRMRGMPQAEPGR